MLPAQNKRFIQTTQRKRPRPVRSLRRLSSSLIDGLIGQEVHLTQNNTETKELNTHRNTGETDILKAAMARHLETALDEQGIVSKLKYSDYKVELHRLVSEGKIEAFFERLLTVAARQGALFKEELSSTFEAQEQFWTSGERIGDRFHSPELWPTMGASTINHSVATILARAAKSVPDTVMLPPTQGEIALARLVGHTEMLRLEAVSAIASVDSSHGLRSPFLHKEVIGNQQVYVPSARVVWILRKARLDLPHGARPTDEAYLKALTRAFRRHTGIEFDETTVAIVRSYFNLVDIFVQQHLTVPGDPIRLAEASHGFGAVDVKGGNELNLVGTAAHMAAASAGKYGPIETPHPTQARELLKTSIVGDAIRAVLAEGDITGHAHARERLEKITAATEKGNAAVTAVFDNIRQEVRRKAYDSLALSADEVPFMGDDGFLIPRRDVAETDLHRYLVSIARDDPGRLRFTWVPSHYSTAAGGQGIEIPKNATTRDEFVKLGFNVEKALASRLAPQLKGKMSQLFFPLIQHPREDKTVVFDLYVVGNTTLTRQEQRHLEESFEQALREVSETRPDNSPVRCVRGAIKLQPRIRADGPEMEEQASRLPLSQWVRRRAA